MFIKMVEDNEMQTLPAYILYIRENTSVYIFFTGIN